MTEKTSFILSDISAIKIILGQYSKMEKKIKEYEDDDNNKGLPLTVIPFEEEDISLADILHEKSKRACYFLDFKKSQLKLWPTMLDVTLNGTLPINTVKLCWWDHHSFRTRPLGCPLRFTKDDENYIYETEGYFCSFPCCKAYIIDKKSDIKYKESLALLSMIFMTIYDKKETIPVAPTWKILKEYGGHLTIQEYRSSIGKLEFEETINFKRHKLVFMSQYIREKRIKPFKIKTTYNSD